MFMTAMAVPEDQNVESLETQKAQVQSQADDVQKQLVGLLVQYDALQQDIEKQKERVSQAQEELKAAEAEEQDHLRGPPADAANRGEGGDGLRPAKAQDADGAWHGRCDDSCDGVGHGRSFPSPPCGNFGNSAVDFFLDCFYVYRNMNNGCFPPMWTSVENHVDNVENPVGQRSSTYLPLFYIAYLSVYAMSKEFTAPYFLSGCQKN